LPEITNQKPLDYDNNEDEEEDEDEFEDELEGNSFSKKTKRDLLNEDTQNNQEIKDTTRKRLKINPADEIVQDPYASSDETFFIPVLVAIGAFVLLVFCLCKI